MIAVTLNGRTHPALTTPLLLWPNDSELAVILLVHGSGYTNVLSCQRVSILLRCVAVMGAKRLYFPALLGSFQCQIIALFA